MEIITVSISALAGAIIGILGNRIARKRNIDRYAENLLMEENGQLRLRVDKLEKQLDECKQLGAIQNAKIISLAAAIRMLRGWLKKQGFENLPDFETLLNGNGL